jgi:hypothetical protein
MSCFDHSLSEPEAHARSITAPLRHLPVTESLALPPDKGAHHVSNPISYDDALPDMPQAIEADACKGSGRSQAALRGLWST